MKEPQVSKEQFSIRRQRADASAVEEQVSAWRRVTPASYRPDLHLEHACGEDGSFQKLKAGHEERFVPICAALADDVASVVWGSGLMFSNVHGEPMTKVDWDNWRTRRFKKAVKAANTKLTKDAGDSERVANLLPDDLNPYDLRASICSLWYRQGIDKATIAAWLGHSIPVLEKSYAGHLKLLDPLDRRTVDEMIAEARG